MRRATVLRRAYQPVQMLKLRGQRAGQGFSAAHPEPLTL